MSAFFESLIARSFSVAMTVRPRPAARFERAEEEVSSEEVSARPTGSERGDEPRRGDEPIGAVISHREEELPYRPDVRHWEEPDAPVHRQLLDRPTVHEREMRTVVEREIRTDHIIGDRSDPDRAQDPIVVEPHEPTLTPTLAVRTPHIVSTQRASEQRQEQGDRVVRVSAPVAQQPEVHVEVTIGRIELGAPPRPTPPVRPRAASPRPAVTLDDYLRRRSESGE